MFDFMFDLIASVLAWFYDLVPSYGLAIVLLTLVVMVVVTPLTLKGTRSMIKMQHLQPEMKKIQARHKGDREQMNRELMAFYQANEINPMGGCLPLFVQAPVFIVLYNVLRGLTRRLSDMGEGVGWVAGRLGGGLTLTGQPSDARVFYPDYLAADSKLFVDLSHETEMVSWGVDLSRSASEALSAGLVTALPYFFLILVVFASSWIQQQQIRGRNKDAPVNPQQQMIMKIMPFFLPVISYTLDAALVLYFVVSNLYRIGQQAYITRKLYGPHATQPAVVMPSTGGKDKGSGGKDKGSGKSGQPGSRKASGTRKPGSGGGSRARSSNAARQGRTTAGENSNESQNKSGDDPPAGAEADAGRRMGRRRSRAGKKQADGPGRSDDAMKRPPAGRRSGGRTTPPGTSRSGGRKKKRRK